MISARRLLGALTLAAVVAGTACAPATDWREAPPGLSAASAEPDPTGATGAPPATTGVPTPKPNPSPSKAPTRPATKPTAPAQRFAVGVRTLSLSRGADRPLPTTVWYPATGDGDRVRRDAPVAVGRFPVVLFSHGLHGRPEYYQSLTTRWAAAGFVVAAPAYPFTNDDADNFDAGDMRNQPADAARVVDAVVALDGRSGDPFAGRLRTDRVAAGGHSAGGFTTAGMFAAEHSSRLRAGIVIAGGPMGQVRSPSAAMLFVHGEDDDVVSVRTGRSLYDRLSWPKAFLTLLDQGHGEYLRPGAEGFDQVVATTTDFLRWTLYGDAAAKGRLGADGTAAGVSTLDRRL